MPGQAAEKVAKQILETYKKKTPKSRAHQERALKFLPGGDTRTTCFFGPYPAYMDRGKGCRLYDCDGNEYLDYLSNYTSLIFGHANEKLIEAGRAQLERGTIFGAPTEIQYRHAQHLVERVPSLETVRYCNSGTEATMFALRGARAYAGKDAVMKMDGGYHGTHDFAEVNVDPDVKATGLPGYTMVPGVPASTMKDAVICPFNDLEAAKKLIEENKDRLAAVLVEPLMGAGGLIYPQPGFLQGLRELTQRYGIVLIFDEIISFRVNRGGMQALEGVTPDMTTLGKWIGGGFPAGAFGGRREIMEVYNPTRPDRVGHGGTFNANNLTIGVGLAALEMVDQPAIDRLNQLGDRLRAGLKAALAQAGLKAQLTGYGSLVGFHWAAAEPFNAKDTALGVAKAGRLPALFHLEMINRGIYAAPRGMYIISMPMGEAEVDQCLAAFKGALEVVKPLVAEETPHLMAN